MIKDLIIIGGGPVGMYAAFYAGLRNLKVTLIEALPYLGGQLETLYKEKYIYDLPGYAKITAGDFIASLNEQMATMDEMIEVKLDTLVETMTKENDLFCVQTTQGIIQTKAILIAAGNGLFKPRPLAIENAKTFENIHYSISNMSQFKDQTIAILGGGDSAVDWAMMLENVAKKVYIVHRRNEFRAKEMSVKQLTASTVQILTPYVASQLNGENNKINQLIIENVEDQATKSIMIDELIVNYGFVSSLGNIKEWPIDQDHTGIFTNQKAETSMPGVYAIGNAASYDGRLNLITVGLGEVPMAIDAIRFYLDPTYKRGNIFSSTMKR